LQRGEIHLSALIEILGEFFLIFDEGEGATSYMTKIFLQIYGGKFSWIFPKHDKNFSLREKFSSNFPHK
jgi:ribonuclease BN (tRNA processing enzyme)